MRASKVRRWPAAVLALDPVRPAWCTPPIHNPNSHGGWTNNRVGYAWGGVRPIDATPVAGPRWASKRRTDDSAGPAGRAASHALIKNTGGPRLRLLLNLFGIRDRNTYGESGAVTLSEPI
jgi:hypothetical protein